MLDRFPAHDVADRIEHLRVAITKHPLWSTRLIPSKELEWMTKHSLVLSGFPIRFRGVRLAQDVTFAHLADSLASARYDRDKFILSSFSTSGGSEDDGDDGSEGGTPFERMHAGSQLVTNACTVTFLNSECHTRFLSEFRHTGFSVDW